MGQYDQGQVMVPPAPEPQLVVVHAQFSLADRAKQVSMGQRMPLTRTKVASGVSKGALLR